MSSLQNASGPGAAQPCPECGVGLPVLSGYVTWCHQCGWNLRSPDRRAPAGRFEALYEKAGERLGRRLVSGLIGGKSLEPSLTPSRLGAYVVAGAVYVFVAALLAVTVAAAVASLHQPFGLIIVVLLGGVAFLMRPRIGKARRTGVVPRAEAPKLYELCDEIAAALETPPVDAIVVDHSFNASWAVLGVKRTRTLTLGLPLLAVLPPQVRAALIAHEFAHGRNGDAARGFIVGSAADSLAEFYFLVAPKRSLDRDPVFGGLEHVVNAVFWLVSRPVWWLLQLEIHLLLRDSQRAEYLADVLAADVAGADAVVELHERLLLASTFYGVVHHAARDTSDALLERAATQLTAVPERERERRRRVARLETARLNSTHPPTASRIELVETRASRDARVVVTELRSAEIDDELKSRRRAVEERLVDEYRASLYY